MAHMIFTQVKDYFFYTDGIHDDYDSEERDGCINEVTDDYGNY